ncbi:MAG TPA: MerR family transcriptional regulator [Gaiellaceae bacterium]|jgi:DNA-binding transcriptional MerR regulator|nr:MerR family transcriptional regulator [Gaiellaceae bacterium]
MSATVEERLLTIGTVCGRLKDEFPDISISKIRYLEDQGLLTPKRTSGGYRLFSEDDVERLTTILRLQRDEFLPLRVIRQELASPTSKERRRRRRAGLAEVEPLLEPAELAERAGIRPEQLRELEEFGLLLPTVADGQKRYPESDVDVAHLCARLAEYGVGPRHLRTLRTSADRVASLIEAITAPALRSRSPERRKAGIEDLRSLGELTQELAGLLLWRQLRRQVTQ